MTSTPSPSPSTCVDIEVPEVDTPMWTSSVPITPFPYTPIMPQSGPLGTSVRFATLPLTVSTPLQTLPRDPPSADHMQLCSSPESSPPSSVGQQDLQDLPCELPTPGRGIQQLTQQVKGDLDSLKESSQKQESAIIQLTREVKDKSSQYATHISNMVVKMEDNQQKLLKCISDNKQHVERWINGPKLPNV